MFHRALFGSFERFLGILIENYAGKFPFWLAPTQVSILTITDDSQNYARKVAAQLRAHKIRVEEDYRNEKISYKVREHTHNKTPVILAIGKKEAENGTVSLRRLGENKNTLISLVDCVKILASESNPHGL